MRRLADFIGRFDVSRRIEDRHGGGQTRFEGQAEITAQAGGAVYIETGALIMGDQRFEAERRYLWRAQDGMICVQFHDGAPFHEFDPEAGGQATEHLCGQDMYRGGYGLSDWPRWSVIWEVAGPRKDYTSHTLYTPL